jgi:pimeloyl-ACP methyl ester carboxylesterase
MKPARYRIASIAGAVRGVCAALTALSIVMTAGPAASTATAQTGTRVLTGTLEGAAYRIEVPAHWNGTLMLFSHGTVTPGTTNRPQVASAPSITSWLLGHDYALAGSAFSATGWAVAAGLHDQIALLDHFDQAVGKPRQVIAWGESLGGLITAGLVQDYPQRLSGALPLCGPLAGTVAGGNAFRDLLFTFKTLAAAHASFETVHFTSSFMDLIRAELALNAAQASARGRARIALAAAFADLPGWYDSQAPAPSKTDVAGQEMAQFEWMRNAVLPYLFIIGADLEARAGGNPTSNVGVDYSRLLARSADRAEVRALYARVGGLDRDLSTLAHAHRLAADPRALAYAERYIALNGRITVPVLTMHTIGDGLVPVEHEQAYAASVASAGRSSLLRQLFVRRAGHCAFTPAEIVTALESISARVDSSQWQPDLSPARLNQTAGALPSALQTGKPAFARFTPPPFLRP